MCNDMRPHYLAANMPLKKDDLDSRRGHVAHWDCLYLRFLGFMESPGIVDLDTIAIKSYRDFESQYGYLVEDNISVKFEDLSLELFQQCVHYVNKQYYEAKNRNQVSGTHDNFSEFVGAKIWLHYYHVRMESSGTNHY